MGRLALQKKGARKKNAGASNPAARIRRGGGLSGLLQRHGMKIFTYTMLGLVLIGMIYPLYNSWQTGRWGRAYDAVTAHAIGATKDQGLVIEEILVDGRHYTDKDQLLQSLGIHQGMPILAFDLDAAQGQLLSLPWVESATVERRMPNTVFIHLTERQPMAVWQNKGALNLIDRKGAVILGQDVAPFSNLLIVVGPDAPSYAKDLVDVLSSMPNLQERVQSAVRVGQRRWDLYLRNDMVIKLPEKNPEMALQKLIELQEAQKILDQDYATIDLRLSDRMYLTPKNADKSQVPSEDAGKPGQST